MVMERGANKVVDLKGRSKLHLLWLQHFIFCTEIEGFCSRNGIKSRLSYKKHFETLPLPLQRDPDGELIQLYDHDQYSRVNHLSQVWSCEADVLLHSYRHPTTFCTSISPSDPCFSNGFFILEKLKICEGSPIWKEREYCASLTAYLVTTMAVKNDDVGFAKKIANYANHIFPLSNYRARYWRCTHKIYRLRGLKAAHSKFPKVNTMRR